MRNKFKALGKKTQVLLITLTIVITAFLSPIFVKTVTAGEIDIFQMVSTLLGKVENQDDKIANLENEIDKLKEQIEQQKPDPVVEEKEEEPKTDPVEEVKPEENRKNQNRNRQIQSLLRLNLQIPNQWNPQSRNFKYT
jgi:outer membrane biosynthesis protein TonB